MPARARLESPIFPAKLASGKHVRVIAPAQSMAMVVRGNNNAEIANAFFDSLGVTVSFGEHVMEENRYTSSSIESRVADLHAAFADDNVDAILTVIGGFNSNELLPYLDWGLIAAHPKIICGYSDITTLLNAIGTKTGLVTYYGPHWSTFGMKKFNEWTCQHFVSTLFDDAEVHITQAGFYTDDLWFIDQENRETQTTQWWPINPGSTQGRIVGGNLCTLNLLQGTDYMPDLAESVLFIEDDGSEDVAHLRRDFHSLMQVPGAETIRGVVFGRFQDASTITREDIELLVESIPSLAGKPVLANIDMGHTNPLITLPLGGQSVVNAGEESSITLTAH